MQIDRDFIPLTLIAALVAIWLSTRPWNDPTAIAVAGDVLKIGLGGVLGYMTKSSLESADQEDYLRELEEENERLRSGFSGDQNHPLK
jgi:hypothetical protein